MLRNMRNVAGPGSGKVIAGVLFTLLILSFAVWGNRLTLPRRRELDRRACSAKTEITAEMAGKLLGSGQRLSIQTGSRSRPRARAWDSIARYSPASSPRRP